MVREAFINIGEYTIFMMMAGQGMPTVILEAGAGDDSSTWKEIFPAIAQFTQVMAYDRARLGRSDSAPLPRTALQLVNDLHDLIQEAQLVGPYILIGHSLGALLCRLYIQQYRDDVAGLILLDGPHPDQGKRFATALTAVGFGDHSMVQAILKTATGVEPEQHPEGLDFARSLTQIDQFQTFGELPLVVISSGKSLAEEIPDLPTQAVLAFDRAWDEMQDELAKLSTKGMHLKAEQSGHYIHWDQPELVVETIQQIVKILQNDSFFEETVLE